jgi:hypothetical protein
MDNDSTEVAKDIYKWIIQGGDGLNFWRSAEGLHKAGRDLRVRLMEKTDPLVWAPSAHIGI